LTAYLCIRRGQKNIFIVYKSLTSIQTKDARSTLFVN